MNFGNRHRELVDGYCSGSLNDEEFAELEAALREDMGLRRQLLEYRMLESALRTFASSDSRTSPNSDDHLQDAGTIRRLRIELWAMATGMAVLFAGVALLGLRGASSNSETYVEPSLDPGVAVLTKAVDVQWGDRGGRQGDSMTPGHWKLVAGTVEMEFYSGASVILEAPAELELVSANGGILHAGKLRAHVPLHSHGFTITTKDVQLVDLGTSFGMEVGTDTGTAVHVFDGKVELFGKNRQRRLGEGYELVAGEGGIVSPTGEASAIEVRPSHFLSSSEVESRSRVQWKRRLESWRASAISVPQDPRLLARYDFESVPDRSRNLVNRSLRTHDGLNGAIIGVRWGEGRWPGKGALDFKRPGDRVRIQVPGESSSLTLAAWLRIDGFDNQFHSLLLSDGWDRLSAVHWQIHKDGFVELAVWNGIAEQTNNSRVSFVMEPSDFGRWMQLAVVYDGEKSIVCHYRDGELLGAVRLPSVIPLAIGNAEIGTWTPPPSSSRQIRHFNGRMDELLVFEGALSAKEISELHQNGKP